MNMNKNYEALEQLLNLTGLALTDIHDLSVTDQDAMYYISFRSDYMFYEGYVDVESMEVLGLDFQPRLKETGARVESLFEQIA
jgi:hypothetical protein